MSFDPSPHLQPAVTPCRELQAVFGPNTIRGFFAAQRITWKFSGKRQPVIRAGSIERIMYVACQGVHLWNIMLLNVINVTFYVI